MLPRIAVLVSALAAATSGCATTSAAVETAPPTLVPPEAPPRVIADYPHDPPLPAEPMVAEVLPPPSRPVRTPRPPSPREPTASGAPDTPEAPPPGQGHPALALQSPAAAAGAEQAVRTLLSRAARDLERVVYAGLDADGRAQFDTARRFMNQAEDALRNKNVMYAGKLADKAATMAAVLTR